jgi:hypothetical protein
MFRSKFSRSCLFLTLSLFAAGAFSDDGVFVRFQLTEPATTQPQTKYFVRLGGYIHKEPWYLPQATIPADADRDASKRLTVGQSTDWFDLRKHAGAHLHGRLSRSGGVAEFPNVTAQFVCEPAAERLTVVIELATAPDDKSIRKRWQDSFTGPVTSFLVSPTLRQDAADLESAAEMTARRLRWAREATGGKRTSPQHLMVQTSFWSPQRAELNLQEAEVLHLLGFNVVGNQTPEVRERAWFRAPGHTHDVEFGPAATREAIEELMKKHAERQREPLDAGATFGFSDEIVARPPIGDNPQALAHFRQWLAQRKIAPSELGVPRLEDVVPIETPDVLREREQRQAAAARRVFYYTSRFRQEAATDRIRWHTEAFHRHSDGLTRPGSSTPLFQQPPTSTLVADHPYFSGSGLGMGMTPNPTWGGAPLACDWFDLARRRAVDMIGIEDWMGLQYMYGPNTTWEGFQLMGFQAAIFRSGSRGQLPIMAWITPSDETNLRLKTASALCQGAKHFFYWTYGPTATSTENYWSDLRGAYDGIAKTTQQLAGAEHILSPGRPRKTRVALLYSISSDLWQPFGYVHMLERRGLYLSLIHDQHLVDLLSEQDIEAGRLDDYAVLYTADPCLTEAAMTRIERWVRGGGGYLFGTCAAGSRNEFNEPVKGLSETFGVTSTVKTTVQPGRYHIRGALNGMAYVDRISPKSDATPPALPAVGVIGTKAGFDATTGQVRATFSDGSPAMAENAFGKGRAMYIGGCPGIAYVKEANFVPDALKEKWPADMRSFLNGWVRKSSAAPLVELSHPVVETGVYDAPQGTALVLANFTYEPVGELRIRLGLPRAVQHVRSSEHGPLQFSVEPARGSTEYPHTVSCRVPLGLTDVILFE